MNERLPDDERVGDPAEMLAMLRGEQDRVNRRLAALVPWILLTWGLCWLIGFLALWGIDGAKPAFSLPLPFAVTVFVVLMVASLAISGILGARSQRGIRTSPESAFTGTVYGITWTVAFIALVVFGAALSFNGMPRELLNIYYPTGSAVLVGLLYMIAGAIWQAKPALWLGVWTLVVALAAPFFGYPANYLVFAVAGGGGFLVGALVLGLWVLRR